MMQTLRQLSEAYLHDVARFRGQEDVVVGGTTDMSAMIMLVKGF